MENRDRKQNPGQKVSLNAKRGRFPPEGYDFFHILLGGNDPFFAFWQSRLGFVRVAVVKWRFEMFFIVIVGKLGWETESGTDSCRICPKRKKRLPAGQNGDIDQKCFRSVPREAAFLRLGIPDTNLSRNLFPIPTFPQSYLKSIQMAF